MLNAILIQSFTKLEAPILTDYLDTNPANPSKQGQPSGTRIWLKSQGKALQATVPRAEQKAVRKQLNPSASVIRSLPLRRSRAVISS